MSASELTLFTALMTVVTAATLVGALCDLRRGIIPDWLTYSLLGGACVFYGLAVVRGEMSGGRAVAHLITGIVVVAGPAVVMFAAGGAGGGDVKLLAALGAWLGWQLGIELLVTTIMLASLQAIVMLGLRGQLGALFRNIGHLMVNAARRSEQRKPLDRASMFELRLAPAIFVGLVIVTWG